MTVDVHVYTCFNVYCFRLFSLLKLYPCFPLQYSDGIKKNSPKSSHRAVRKRSEL